MARIFHDANSAAERVKARQARLRPVGEDPNRRACQTLTPAARRSASYPSGSAAVATAYGEAFAALEPDRAEAVRRIGYEIGVSRLICAMHYPTDVAVGERIGRDVAARVVATPAFQADMAAARAELAAARRSGLTNPGCAAERAALAIPLP
ncbi:MAG: acid phosphatase (class A) [Brevundimonas sp.]|jgi:acid phosphatase (class A)